MLSRPPAGRERGWRPCLTEVVLRPRGAGPEADDADGHCRAPARALRPTPHRHRLQPACLLAPRAHIRVASLAVTRPFLLCRSRAGCLLPTRCSQLCLEGDPRVSGPRPPPTTLPAARFGSKRCCSWSAPAGGVAAGPGPRQGLPAARTMAFFRRGPESALSPAASQLCGRGEWLALSVPQCPPRE